MKKILVLILLLITGCSSIEKRDKISSSIGKKDKLYEYYLEYKGTPYKLGGTDKTGIDCSAFVQGIFSNVYKVSLPRTTQSQMQVGKEINYKERDTGDLLFFKTGVNTYHVGVYYENDNFMHASTSKGVMISNLNESYWINSFLNIKRIIK